MTAIFNASPLIQLGAMVALLGLASAPILVWRLLRFTPTRQRVVADRRQLRAEADLAAATPTHEWARKR